MGKINLNFLKTKEKTNPDTRTYEELLGLVLEYMPEDEYKKWEGKRGKVGAYSHEWPEFNNTTTPKEWLSIYRYSQTYAASTIKTKSLPCKDYWNGNVLDFGAGGGKPWGIPSDNINLYMYEANLYMVDFLKENYKNQPNVKIVNTFNDIKDIKFNHIFSCDVLEHVRYINEHLSLLWLLGDENCKYELIIDVGSAGGHVLNLHADTKINSWWNEIT